MTLIELALANAKNASRRSDIFEAERSMKIADRKVAIDERRAKLTKATQENRERDLERRRKARIEREQRSFGDMKY